MGIMGKHLQCAAGSPCSICAAAADAMDERIGDLADSWDTLIFEAGARFTPEERRQLWDLLERAAVRAAAQGAV